MDWSVAVQAVLFALFVTLSSALYAVIAPTYSFLLVPELQPSALYPAFPPDPGAAPTFLTEASAFSAFLVTHVVDPALGLLAIVVGIVYLARSVWPDGVERARGLLPRLLITAVLVNFTQPIAAALLGVAGAIYPAVAGFDGGAWQDWSRIDGFGSLGFAWDNGALNFVISIVLFSVVFGLALLVALRNALLGVLLVLLPLFTLLWPIPSLAPLAGRVWWLFGALCFLPCLVVIPLELAVGSANVLVLLGYLTVALSVPALLGVAGNQLTALGFPGASGFVVSGLRQGLGSASQGFSRVLSPLAVAGGGRVSRIAGIAARATASAPVPTAFPLLAADFLGRGGAHLVRHLPGLVRRAARGSDSFPGVRRPPEGRP